LSDSIYLLPDSSLFDLWFVRRVSLVWLDLAPIFVPDRTAALPSETFGILIEKVGVNGTMASLIPVNPGVAVPIDFEFAYILSTLWLLFM
jgi:hypothetical protein